MLVQVDNLEFRSTPLIVAACCNNKPMIEFLCASKADLNLAGASGTALHQAVSNSSSECIALLIAHSADVNVASAGIQKTYPLIHAVQMRNKAAVDALLDAKADVTKRTCRGVTALFAACSTGTNRHPIVDSLLLANANPNQLVSRGSTDLHGHTLHAHNCTSSCNQELQMTECKQNGKVQNQWQATVDPNQGASPLMAAIGEYNDAATTCKALLGAEADPNHCKTDLDSVLSIAYGQCTRNESLIEILIDAGAEDIATPLSNIEHNSVEWFTAAKRQELMKPPSSWSKLSVNELNSLQWKKSEQATKASMAKTPATNCSRATAPMVKAPMVSSDQAWNCWACTLTNLSIAPVCSACSAPRDIGIQTSCSTVCHGCSVESTTLKFCSKCRAGNCTETAFDTTETAFDTTETAFDTTETAFDTTETAFDTTETALAAQCHSVEWLGVAVKFCSRDCQVCPLHPRSRGCIHCIVYRLRIGLNTRRAANRSRLSRRTRSELNKSSSGDIS